MSRLQIFGDSVKSRTFCCPTELWCPMPRHHVWKKIIHGNMSINVKSLVMFSIKNRKLRKQKLLPLHVHEQLTSKSNVAIVCT